MRRNNPSRQFAANVDQQPDAAVAVPGTEAVPAPSATPAKPPKPRRRWLWWCGILLLVLWGSKTLLWVPEMEKSTIPRYALIDSRIQPNPAYLVAIGAMTELPEAAPAADTKVSTAAAATAAAATAAAEPADSEPVPIAAEPEPVAEEVIPVTEPQPADQTEIERLLALAELRLQEYRLTIPRGDSAYDYFNQVLQLDADNAAAVQGLKRIPEKYLQLAHNALNRDDLVKAKRFVDTGLRIDGQHVQLLALREEIAELAAIAPAVVPAAAATSGRPAAGAPRPVLKPAAPDTAEDAEPHFSGWNQ